MVVGGTRRVDSAHNFSRYLCYPPIEYGIPAIGAVFPSPKDWFFSESYLSRILIAMVSSSVVVHRIHDERWMVADKSNKLCTPFPVLRSHFRIVEPAVELHHVRQREGTQKSSFVKRIKVVEAANVPWRKPVVPGDCKIPAARHYVARPLAVMASAGIVCAPA